MNVRSGKEITMKRIILAIVLIIALALPAVSFAMDEMVTIDYPDGSTVQMTLEAYRLLYLNTTDAPVIVSTETPHMMETPAPTAVVEEEAEPENPWPTYVLRKHPLDPVQKNESDRVMGYLGPSRNYAETDSFKPNGIKRADGLFVEGDFVCVDMNYPSVGVRRVYFYRRVFQSTGSVPETTLVGYPAVTTDSVLPRYGPGSVYDPFPDASVGPDTPLSVFFEESGYVFAEYEVDDEVVRAWIVAVSVAPKDTVETIYTTFAP
jgi:hypothetical protein